MVNISEATATDAPTELLAMLHEAFRDLLASGRVRMAWVRRPTPIARLHTWHLHLSDDAGRTIEIDTGLTTADGDRYGELVTRAAVKTAACLLALSGAEVILPSGEPFSEAWLTTAVRPLEPSPERPRRFGRNGPFVRGQ